MGNFFLILTIFRSIPAFIVFHTLNEKQAVREDMRRWGEMRRYGVCINCL